MLVYGKQSTDEVTPLLVDASGRVIVSGDSPSTFRPIPQGARITNNNLPAGVSDQTVFTVPANELWRLTTLSVTYNGVVAGVVLSFVVFPVGSVVVVGVFGGIANGVANVASLNCLLGGGYAVRINVAGATAGDVLFMDYLAERIY